MVKVSMRVDYTLEQYSLADQIKIAKDVGADGVETGELKNLDCDAARKVADDLDIPFVACGFYDIWNARIGTPFSVIKGNLEKTIECAKMLGTDKLMSLTIDSEDRSPQAIDKFIDNILQVVEECEKNDMILVLEPHSTIYTNPLVDMSAYFLNMSKMAYEVIGRIGSANVKMLFDFYHIQTMEGNIMMNIKQNIDDIVHFHIAGVPGRNEPMNGELCYPNIVKFVDDLDYNNYFGLEYFPTESSNIEKIAEAVSFVKNGFGQ